MNIEPLVEADSKALSDINLLLAQLRVDPLEHDALLADLEQLTHDANVVLMVVKDESKIIGMATLYLMHKLGKQVAHVEDVVVDSAYRGQGLGKQLMEAVIEVAKAKGVKSLHLTSRPARVAANKLYQKIGFQLKETNVYRMTL